MKPEKTPDKARRRSSRSSRSKTRAADTAKSASSHTGQGIEPSPLGLRAALESLQPHDHLCLIYESRDEWRQAAIPFVAIGLERGEKCIYVVDANTARQIRRHLVEEGVNTTAAERSGKLAILHHTEAYTTDGTFDPDRMISMLADETKKALADGYPALRVTGEMTWVLRGHPGSDRVLEYEAKLNRDLFPRYPCVAICQYNRWEFSPEIIKGVVLTHPLLIRGSRLYHNFYYVPPEEYLSDTQAEREVQHWLNNLERERAQYEGLREREERYRLLFEQSLDAITMVSPDGRFIDANQAWLDLFGYTHGELSFISVYDIYADPADREDFLRRIGEAGFVRDEVRFKKKDGTVFDCRRSTTACHDASGHVIAYQGIYHDVTEEKKAEAALRESERRYRVVAEFSPDWDFWAAPGGRFMYVSPACHSITGYSREEFMQDPSLMTRIMQPEFHAAWQDHLDKEHASADTGASDRLELLLQHRNGDFRWIEHHCRPVFDHDGQYLGRRGVNRDITELKRIREALGQSEEKFRSLFEQSLDAIWSLKPDGTNHEVNQAWLDMFGYNHEDLATLNAADLYADPADRDAFLRQIEEEGQIRDDVRFKRKDGSIFICQRTVVARRDADGRIVAFQGVNRDITDRIRIEEKLRNSEEKYRALFEQSTDAITLVAPDGASLEANDAWLKLFGYTREDLPHIHVNQIYADPSERERFLQEIYTNGIVRDIVRFRRKDGSEFDCQRTAVIQRDSSGNIIGFQNIQRDITLERQREQALRESEEKYRTLFEQSRDAIGIVAPDGTHVDANEAWLQLFGYTRDELAHITAREIYANPAEREHFLRRIAEAGVVKDVVKFKRKDGTVFDCQRTVVAQRDQDGTPVAFFNVLRDITEDRQREQALRESEEKSRSLFEQSMDAIALVAVDGTLLDANPAYWRLFGFDPGEVGRINVRDHYLHPEEREDFLRHMDSEGLIIDEEQKLVRKDGTVIDCLRSSVARRDEHGRVVAYQTVLRDVTTRRKAEQQLRESEDELRRLTTRLEAIREEERAGIARELHDQVGQALTALRMDLATLQGQPQGEPVSSEKLAQMIELVDATTDDVRRISSELRPGILDDFGLIPAMEWQLDQFQKRTNIQCELKSSGDEVPDSATATALYRVFQELLTNVARHAAAQHVTVLFERDDGDYILTVADDGRGITEEQMHSPSSLGLIGTRERLRPLGGHIELSGAPGKGTTVRVTVPVRQ